MAPVQKYISADACERRRTSWMNFKWLNLWSRRGSTSYLRRSSPSATSPSHRISAHSNKPPPPPPSTFVVNEVCYKVNMAEKVYICLSVTSAAYSSRTYAAVVLSANLSRGPSSSVTLFQGGMANFNISLSVQELGAFFRPAQRFCSFLQTINIRMSERLCVLKHGRRTGSLILQLQSSETQKGIKRNIRRTRRRRGAASCDWLERGSRPSRRPSVLEISVINHD